MQSGTDGGTAQPREGLDFARGEGSAGAFSQELKDEVRSTAPLNDARGMRVDRRARVALRGGICSSAEPAEGDPPKLIGWVHSMSSVKCRAAGFMRGDATCSVVSDQDW